MAKLIIETTVVMDGRVIPRTHTINGVDDAVFNKKTAKLEVKAEGRKYKDLDKLDGRDIDSWRVEVD